MAWLTHIHTFDEANTARTLYISAGLEAPLVDGTLHEEVSQTILRLGTKIFQDYGKAAAAASKGDVTLIIDEKLDVWKRHYFRGSEIEIYEGSGKALSGYGLRFRGSIAGATHSENQLTLSLRDNSWKLDRPLNIPEFIGTGDLEGGEDLKGKKKPLILGEPLAVDPSAYLIDGLHLIYMVSYRAIEAITKVTDGGNLLTFAGDYPNLSALRAASLSFGEYATCLALGLIKLGGRIALKLAVWAKGDNAGGYTNLPGSLITHVLDNFADLTIPTDSAALTALDTGHPYPLGFYIDTEVTAASVIESICVSSGAFWHVNRLGDLSARIIAMSTPSYSFGEDDYREFKKTEDRPVIKKLKIGYARIEAVHSAGELAKVTSDDIDGLPDALTKLDGISEGADVSAEIIEALVLNPSFEGFGNYWDAGAAWSFVKDAALAYDGEGVAIFDAALGQASTGGPHGQQPFAAFPLGGLYNEDTEQSNTNLRKMIMAPGDRFKILGVARNSDGADIQMALAVDWYRMDGTLISRTTGPAETPGTDWSLMQHIFTAPAETFVARFLWLPVSWTTGKCYVDQVRFAGVQGADGGYVDVRFIRSELKPTTPTGDEPAGWTDGPPEADGNPLWMSKGFKTALDTLVGAWSDPVQIEGAGQQVQYSIDGETWHTPPFEENDIYMRQRLTSDDAWSIPIRIVGEDGENGTDGGYIDVRFRRSSSTPSTPSGNNPSGWSDGPPAANGYPLWMIRGSKTAADELVGNWSTPAQVGGDGLEVQYSTNGSIWDNPPFQTGHLYMRTRAPGGTWSNAVRIVGEKGDPGANGSDGADGANGVDGVDGADGAPGISALHIAYRLNYNPSTGSHSSWCKVHGFDANGDPDESEPAKIIREDGSVTEFGGTSGTSASGLYGASLINNASFYIVIDLSGANFSRSGTSNGRVVPARKVGSTWEYYAANAGWTVFTPDSDHFIIGIGYKGSSFERISNVMMDMEGAPELGAVQISDTEHLANNAATLPKSYDATGIQLNHSESSGGPYGTVGSALTGIPFTAGEGAAVKLSFDATFRCNDDPIRCYARWQRRPSGGSWTTIRTMSQLVNITSFGSATQRFSICSSYTDEPGSSGTYEYRLQAWGQGEQTSDRAYFDNFNFEVQAVRK